MDAKNNDMRLSRLLLPALLFVLCLSPLGATAGDDKYSAEELDEIVAPIALYPDVVISSLLPASTVPTDVVQAARWIGDQDGEITEVPEDSGWDEAVEALVQFPDVVTWMSENLDWMEMLGYAVAVQEDEVLQAIQDFRAKAQDAGNLESDEHMQVQEEDGAIYIEPAQPEVVYVPTYNPTTVVQPGYSWSSWGVGFAMGAVGAWAVHSIRWGGHGHGHGSININNNRYNNFNNNGNINRGNINSGNRWNAANKPNRRPNTRPNQRPKNANYGNRKGARPGKGGVRPPKGGGQRPGGKRPGSRPGDRPGSGRPGSKPGGSRPGSKPGGSRPGSKPGGKPSTRPSKAPSRPSTSRGSKSTMNGSSRSGRSTKQASSRGNRSMSGGSRSRSSSSRSRSSGGSRSGGSRGGSRGGGRGGGGRRR